MAKGFLIPILGVMLALFATAAAQAADPRTPLDLLGHPWSFSAGSEFPGARGSFAVAVEDGQPVGKLAYDFTQGGLYVAGVSAVDIPGGAEELRFRVRSEAWQKIGVRLFDATGQCHQYEVPYADEGDWQLLRVDLASKATMTFGGAKDAKMHFPARKISLAVNHSDSSPTGTVLFADFMLVK